MASPEKFVVSAHAVITNDADEVLHLKQAYGSLRWGLPGGVIEQGESVDEGLFRECREELSCDIEIIHLTGVYHLSDYGSQALVFRCQLPLLSRIILSNEHSEFRYLELSKLPPVHRTLVEDSLAFSGKVGSGVFAGRD